MSSDASRQTFTFFRGRTIEAVATTAAMQAIKVLNCPIVICPGEARAEGTSRYSFNRAREIQMRDSDTAFRTASLGVPPKANAETRTPVSITRLLFRGVLLPPAGLDPVLNVLWG